MKQCLKLFPLVLLLALFLTAPGRAAGTKSEAETRLEIQVPESAVKKGEEFSVTVVLSGNPGFHSAGLTLTYDKSAMECTGIEKGSVLKGSMDALNPDGVNGAVVSAISLRMMSGNGVLAEFFFQAVKPLDAFPFALTEVTLTDFDGKELPCTAPSLFADISGHWAETAVIKAVQKGMFDGFPDGTFRPQAVLTRGEYVAALWNMAGQPTVTGKTSFQDIATQRKAVRDAVQWAYVSGYISGTSTATFSPDLPLTRQAAVKILFAFHGEKSGAETLLSSFIDNAFTDSDKISVWARPAMNWAVYHELIQGDRTAALNPGAIMTRAQAAVLLNRYLETYPMQEGAELP